MVKRLMAAGALTVVVLFGGGWAAWPEEPAPAAPAGDTVIEAEPGVQHVAGPGGWSWW